MIFWLCVLDKPRTFFRKMVILNSDSAALGAALCDDARRGGGKKKKRSGENEFLSPPSPPFFRSGRLEQRRLTGARPIIYCVNLKVEITFGTSKFIDLPSTPLG